MRWCQLAPRGHGVRKVWLDISDETGGVCLTITRQVKPDMTLVMFGQLECKVGLQGEVCQREIGMAKARDIVDRRTSLDCEKDPEPDNSKVCIDRVIYPLFFRVRELLS